MGGITVQVNSPTDKGHTLSFLGATSVGVGAIVGGGILALAGVAFTTAGPSALLAFALNGVIALLTALSFAEVSAAYPKSGGTYAFAKRVLNIHAAFVVGWIVWFASIVAGVLYAFGFAVYAVIVLKQVWSVFFGLPPNWLTDITMQRLLAVVACTLYSIGLVRKRGGGSDWATYGKVIVFAILVLAGVWALGKIPLSEVQTRLTPFMPNGWLGVFQAMGFTFIALQGFDLIAAVAGEVKQPNRNIPRSMLLSLGIALIIYLPFLFIITTVGLAPGESIVELSTAQPEALIAIAVQRYLGITGYWLVLVAALLSMLSALQANLFAASRIAFAMAKDQTLPRGMGLVSKGGMPVMATAVSSLTLIALLLVIPNLAAAGAAASLIFLISFALVHGISILARLRTRAKPLTFTLPWFPLIPIIGGAACVILAIFQGIVVPSAGGITLVWLILGLGIYTTLFARGALTADATAEALDPTLVQLRGRSPLVLVPIANPDNAAALVSIAHTLATPTVGRVSLLSIVVTSKTTKPQEIAALINKTQLALSRALLSSVEAELYPESLMTISADPWLEIARVAKIHRCENLLIGLSHLSDEKAEGRLGTLLSTVDCNVTLLRAPTGWSLTDNCKVLVPVAGGSHHDALRARLLISLRRKLLPEVTFLRVLSEDVTDASYKRAKLALERFAREEFWGTLNVKLVKSKNPISEVLDYTTKSDLVILGSQRTGHTRVGIGNFAKQVIQQAKCGVLVINHRN